MVKKVKTAISIQDSLFKEAEGMAHELHLSRSQLFAMAVEQFISIYRNKKLLEQLDHAYADEPASSEERLRIRRKKVHRRLVQGEW